MEAPCHRPCVLHAISDGGDPDASASAGGRRPAQVHRECLGKLTKCKDCLADKKTKKLTCQSVCIGYTNCTPDGNGCTLGEPYFRELEPARRMVAPDLWHYGERRAGSPTVSAALSRHRSSHS